MTTTQSSIHTTTVIRRGASIQLSISYDFTGLDISMPMPEKFKSQIDQAIVQWWNGLTSFQRSAASARPLSLKISAHCLP